MSLRTAILCVSAYRASVHNRSLFCSVTLNPRSGVRAGSLTITPESHSDGRSTFGLNHVNGGQPVWPGAWHFGGGIKIARHEFNFID